LTADDPAVALVQFIVIGGAGAVFLDRVEDGALEFRCHALIAAADVVACAREHGTPVRVIWPTRRTM
jgi:hypothetical protein